MKNKVYLYNFPKEFQNKFRSGKYDIYFFNLPVEKPATYTANGIIIYGSLDEHPVFLDFFKEIIYISPNDFSEYENYFLKYLDENIGRARLINPKQFSIIKGSIVKSKSDIRLGPGVVDEIEGDNIKVKFPKAKEFYETDIIKCHKSNLRVITHIEEVKKYEF